jgi:hypothetical protein
MFHSSGSRHERYIIRSKQRATLHKERSSLESEISGADSGYTSSSSTPSTTSPTAITPPVLHVIPTDTPVKPTTVDNTTIIVSPPPAAKKKKPKKHQPPRQPDLVYSCPRPLAFPFHNDDHFLPIAEADPRDVARVSPSLNRSTSLQSSKTSVGSTRMYDSSQYSNRALDAESSYSRQSSILSTIQRGTVRSIRSLFQLPDSISNSSNLSRINTNNTSHTRDSTSTAPLQKLQIKKGTVQSIKDMFSMKRSSIQAQRVTQPPPRQQKGRVGTTVGQFESNMDYSRASIANKKQQAPAVAPKPSLASRASEFASRALWKSAPKPPQQPPSAVKAAREAAATKPLPKDPTTKPKTIKSEVKKLSARMFALPKKWSNNDNNEQGRVSLPVVTDPKPKRSLFSSFRRSDISATTTTTVDKKGTDTAKTAVEEVPATPTKVGKMWKSFKSLVTGKKSSRVGVL